MGDEKLKIAVAMSGGVDSSMAAVILKRQGHDVAGVMMKIWSGDESLKLKAGNACFGPDETLDIEKASKVAEKIGIPFYEFDLKKEYKDNVLNPFCSSYLSGRTPNPCVICNQKIKFGVLSEKAKEKLDFDYFATGHYARVEYSENLSRYLLKRGIDEAKDQSYFLYNLRQDQLKKTIFPLGTFRKKEIWALAKELGFEFKSESQDFISGNDYSVLFNEGKESGPIIDASGEQIGTHNGIINYTIGQRKGLTTLLNKRLYVSAIEPETNTIRVDLREKLFSSGILADNMNWISIPKLNGEIKVTAKIRSNHKEASATIAPKSSNEVSVKFDEPQFAITPGQSVVFYKGDNVVGGGVIHNLN